MLSAAKLMIMAFFTLIIGLVLTQPIADDIQGVSTSSISTVNESLTLSVTTLDITNETVALVDGPPGNKTGTTTHSYLTALNGIQNGSPSTDNLIGDCNITLQTGVLLCNGTNNTELYINYTYNAFSIATLAEDELVSADACRNSSMTAITLDTYCNVTLTSGAVRVDFDNFTDNLAFIDYTYTPDNYVRSGSARTILSQTNLFFAIAILLIGMGFAIAAFKQSGIM